MKKKRDILMMSVECWILYRFLSFCWVQDTIVAFHLFCWNANTKPCNIINKCEIVHWLLAMSRLFFLLLLLLFSHVAGMYVVISFENFFIIFHEWPKPTANRRHCANIKKIFFEFINEALSNCWYYFNNVHLCHVSNLYSHKSE